MVLKVILDQLVMPEIRDSLDSLALKDRQVKQDREVILDNKDLQVHLAIQVTKDLLAAKEVLGSLDKQVHLEILANKGQKVRQVNKDLLDQLVQLEILAL